MTQLNPTINRDEQLDISIERVKKLDHPLLVIGLGGSGADMVRMIKHTFAERYELPRDSQGNLIPVPKKTAYLVFDTDQSSKSGFDNHEFKDLSLPGLNAILDPKSRDSNLEAFERKWVNKRLDAASSGVGAGTYRQAARFMLSKKMGVVLPAINNTLQDLCSVGAGSANTGGRVNIIICTGVCGGTGSGTFLDIAQVVRRCMKENHALNALQYRITGYLVMPDLSLNAVKGNAALENVLKCNGYAALKELDFWMRVGEHKTPYTMQYDAQHSISWTMPPFDACIMLSGTTISGKPYTNAYQVMLKTVAENLLHYMADEAPPSATDIPYTYISYEDNLKAAVTNLRKRLPLFYGYRAIGAYTKRIPKKKVLYYEGGKVFATFVPPRDENHHLVPNTALRSDGKSGERAASIVGDLPNMYGNFQTKVPLPAHCNADPSNAPQLEMLRSMNPLPHERTSFGNTPWIEATVLPSCIKASESYLNGAWERFTQFAKGVITDPELGPFSLLDYLTTENGGLMPKMRELEQNWAGMATSFSGGITAKLGLCKSSWPDFVKPPLLSGKKAIALYLQALRDYYDMHRKCEFVKMQSAALSRLVKRMEEYLRDSLRPMCDDLLELSQEFAESTASASDEQIESDIFLLSSIKEKIDQDFTLNNVDSKISREFLGQLSDASVDTMRNVDAHSSGVSFTYKAQRSKIVVNHLRSSLELCFSGINDQSLDAIMLQTAGQELAAQQKYMDDLGKSVLQSAKPMFAQDPAFASELAVEYSYLSVPSDATQHLARFGSTMSSEKVQPKESSIRDHLYCVTALDGLPLYRYNQIGTLENAYWETLSEPAASMGIHLVWDGESDSDYTVNWTKLPSPCPYYFFSHIPPHKERQYHEEVRSLVNRAIASGLLVVDSSGPKPEFHLKFHYMGATQTTFKDGETIKKDVDAIRNEKDPVTGGPLQPNAVFARVEGYLKEAVNKTLTCGQSPACLAPAMGLADQPCDPFDEAIQADPALMRQAEKNHLLLSREMATAVIARYPMFVSALERQLGGVEYARKTMNDIMGRNQAWRPRIAYAEQFTQLWAHGIIFPSMMGWVFRDAEGVNTPLLQPNLLQKDLETESDLIKYAGYLADLDEKNPIRYELGVLLQQAEEDLKGREAAGTLTREDLQALLDRITGLLGLCSANKNQILSAKRSPNADLQRLELVLQLTESISNVANNLSGSLQLVQSNLK